MRPMLEQVELQNYGCVTSETFRLTPLHALIGPNDSGKSTVLRAIRTMSALARFNEGGIGSDRDLLPALMANAGAANGVQLSATVAGKSWDVHVLKDGRTFERIYPRGRRDLAATHDFVLPAGSQLVRTEAFIYDALARSQMFRLDPDVLRQPSALLVEGQPLRFGDERGHALSGLIDALFARTPDLFFDLNAEVKSLFPVVKSLNLKNVSAGQKALGVQLEGGTYVGAELLSEGLLYYLAYAVLRHLDPSALLLIEEPENGLHPARIADVIKILRAISKHTQVILTTHSPLVVNELNGDEVSVLTRTKEAGTKAILMKDTPNFEERSKVYALGELWLSYADGTSETALVDGGPRP